jgi:hypothetical protein
MTSSNCFSITETTAPAWFTSLNHLEWTAPVSNWLGHEDVKDPNHSTHGTHARIIDAWNGMLADESRRTIAMLGNGGHNDYHGNEVYSCDLSLDSPMWIRRRDMTPKEATSGNHYAWSDGSKVSNHTANAQIAVNGQWYVLGIYATNFSGGSNDRRCWRYDPVENEWDDWGDIGTVTNSGGHLCGMYDPATGYLLLASGYGTAYVTLDGTFVEQNTNQVAAAALCGGVDTINGIQLNVHLSQGDTTRYRWRHLGSSGSRTSVMNTIDGSGVSGPVPPDHRWAIHYHEPSQAFLTWSGDGRSLLKLTPTVEDGDYTGLAWSEVTATGVEPLLGDSKMYNKIQLIRNMGNGDSALIATSRYAFPDTYVCRIVGGI